LINFQRHPPAPAYAIGDLREPVPLRVLLVEDRPSDAALLVHLLRQAGFAPEWTRVETELEYLIHLDPALDIILADYALPQFSGLEALRLLHKRGLTIPFILITGTAGEEAAVEALHLGADDYLLKDRLARLGRAVTRALERRALRLEHQRSEQDLRDSELRLLNQERTARAAAEAAVRVRDEFVAIASHELRTPITSIKLAAQTLLNRFDQGDVERSQIVRSMSMVNLMSDRLNLLVADLLDVSRLRTGELELRPEPLDVVHLAQEVLSQGTVGANGLHPLTFSVRGVLPRVTADSLRIGQVLSNVIENAVKYSPKGGPVDVVLRAEGSGVLVSVSDCGIGFPIEAREAIFEPFGRATNAQQQRLPGMGLGLYISRQIIEQHRGRIWATSAGVGSGTTVNIWLPCETRGRAPEQQLRVLVVDDEAGIRDGLGGALELNGYECRLAATGQAALDVLAEWPADIIVLDLMMPVMDGWAFRAAQCAAAELRDIPVVVVSASQAHTERNQDLKPSATISKPFELPHLFDTLQDVLRAA
jgi:signal transduction histidine kinase